MLRRPRERCRWPSLQRARESSRHGQRGRCGRAYPRAACGARAAGAQRHAFPLYVRFSTAMALLESTGASGSPMPERISWSVSNLDSRFAGALCGRAAPSNVGDLDRDGEVARCSASVVALLYETPGTSASVGTPPCASALGAPASELATRRIPGCGSERGRFGRCRSGQQRPPEGDCAQCCHQPLPVHDRCVARACLGHQGWAAARLQRRDRCDCTRASCQSKSPGARNCCTNAH